MRFLKYLFLCLKAYKFGAEAGVACVSLSKNFRVPHITVVVAFDRDAWQLAEWAKAQTTESEEVETA